MVEADSTTKPCCRQEERKEKGRGERWRPELKRQRQHNTRKANKHNVIVIMPVWLVVKAVQDWNSRKARRILLLHTPVKGQQPRPLHNPQSITSTLSVHPANRNTSAGHLLFSSSPLSLSRHRSGGVAYLEARHSIVDVVQAPEVIARKICRAQILHAW